MGTTWLIMSCTILLQIRQGSVTDLTRTTGQGEIIIKETMAYVLQGRPKLQTGMIHLQQKILFKDIRTLINKQEEAILELAKLCQYSPKARKKRTTQDDPFTVVDYNKNTHNEIDQKCGKLNLMMPELTSKGQIQTLVEFLEGRKIPSIILNTRFDQKIGRNVYLHSKRNPVDIREIETYISPQTKDLQKINNTVTTFAKDAQGKWQIITHNQENQRTSMINKELGPVVCQSTQQAHHAKGHEEMLEQIGEHRLCTSAITSYGKRNILNMNQYEQVYTDFGLVKDETKERVKRFLPLLAIMKGTGGLIGLAYNIWNDRQQQKTDRSQDKRIQAHSIQIDKLHLKTTTTENKVKELDNKLEQLNAAVLDLKSNIKVITKLQELEDSFEANQQQVNILIRMARDILEDIRDNKIPLILIPHLNKEMQRHRTATATVMPDEHQPILIESVISEEEVNVVVNLKVATEIWDLYQVLPMPTFKGDTMLMIRPEYEFVLIDSLAIYFKGLSKKTADECKGYICTTDEVSRKTISDPCTVRQFKGRKAEEKCPIIEGPAEPILYQTDRGTIYAMPKEKTGILSCKLPEYNPPGIDGIVILKETGYIQIPEGCSVQVEEEMILYGPPETFTSFALDQTLNLNLTRQQQSWFDRMKSATKGNLKPSTTWEDPGAPIKEEISHMKGTIVTVMAILIVIIGIIALIYGLKTHLIAQQISKRKREISLIRDRVNREVVERLQKLWNYHQRAPLPPPRPGEQEELPIEEPNIKSKRSLFKAIVKGKARKTKIQAKHAAQDVKVTLKNHMGEGNTYLTLQELGRMTRPLSHVTRTGIQSVKHLRRNRHEQEGDQKVEPEHVFQPIYVPTPRKRAEEVGDDSPENPNIDDQENIYEETDLVFHPQMNLRMATPMPTAFKERILYPTFDRQRREWARNPNGDLN